MGWLLAYIRFPSHILRNHGGERRVHQMPVLTSCCVETQRCLLSSNGGKRMSRATRYLSRCPRQVLLRKKCFYMKIIKILSLVNANSPHWVINAWQTEWEAYSKLVNPSSDSSQSPRNQTRLPYSSLLIISI